MKVGIVGTRHVHAAGLAEELQRQGATIAGACEHDAQARAAWKLSPLVELEQLLETCDAIVVAGTNRERVDDTIAASRAGLPTLAEKPVATSASELERLRAGVDPQLVMVALPLRFSAAMQQAREVVRSGAIGTVLAARGTNHGQFPGGWFGTPAESGGGALQDHVVHLSDGLCWLLDDRVARTHAVTANRMDLGIEVEDCGIVTVDFAGGAFASIDCSWSRPRSFPTWGDVWLEVVGTGGRMHIDPLARHLDVFSDDAGKLVHRGYSPSDMSREMIAAFLEFAASPRSMAAPVTFDEGVHASDVVAAAYAAAATGTVVDVTERSPAVARRTDS